MSELDEAKEKQQELIKQLGEAGWKLEEDERFKGLLRDVQSERKSRQTAEEALREVREENQMLTEELAGKTDETGHEDDNGAEDEGEYLTVGRAKKLLAKTLEEGKVAETEEKQQALAQRFAESEEKAKEEFTTEKMGEGLDYSTVLKEGYKKMVAHNPGYQQVVKNSRDPAREAYQIGLLEPEIAKRLDAQKNTKLLASMRVGGGPKGAIETASLEQQDYETLINTPDSELMKSLKADEEKRK